MNQFGDAALSFPAALFTFLLIVVVAYWFFVLLGAVGIDAPDADPADSGASDGVESGGFNILASFGLSGLPVTVVLSMLIAFAWFLSLAGGVLLSRPSAWGPLHAALSGLVLLVAVVGAWLGTYTLVRPLRRLFPAASGASRSAFVGRSCVVRTGYVTADFGQAEVTARDGSSALIQVRTTGVIAGAAGWSALIYDYDADGEFFWVTPVDGLPGN